MVKCPLLTLEVLNSHPALFVFSIDGPNQNATSLLTPVSNKVFYALSSGTLGFALHGCSLNHFLIGGYSSTAIRFFDVSGY